MLSCTVAVHLPQCSTCRDAFLLTTATKSDFFSYLISLPVNSRHCHLTSLINSHIDNVFHTVLCKLYSDSRSFSAESCTNKHSIVTEIVFVLHTDLIINSN